MGIAEKIPATGKSLALVDDLTPDKVYGTPEASGLKAILKRIEDEVRGTIIDVSSEAGRAAARSLRFKVARSKTVIDDMGKGLVEPLKRQAGAIDAERKIARDTLDALSAEVIAPVDAWEETERQRVADHLNAITAIEELERGSPDDGPSVFADRLLKLSALCQRDFQEFGEQAATAAEHAQASINAQYAAAVKREADRAELEQLRAKNAELERREAERQRAQQAAAAAEAQRIADAEAAQARKEREEQIAREAAERAVADAEAARKRETDAAAAAQALRESNKRHRAKVIDGAVSALVAAGIDEDSAGAAIDAIVEGKVPNVTVSF